MTELPMRGGGLRIPTQDPNQARSHTFAPSAVRLARRLLPQRGLTTLVVALSVVGIALSVIGPRIGRNRPVVQRVHRTRPPPESPKSK